MIKKQKTKRINLRCSDDLYNFLENYSISHNLSLSETYRLMVEYFQRKYNENIKNNLDNQL